MGQINKTPKGEISIENNAGRIRLRWRHNCVRYSLNLYYAYSLENLHHATLKSAEIKLDMMKGCFDTTLEKYKWRSYGFTYDISNRLTKAEFNQYNTSWNLNDNIDFTVSNLTYDANGNIKSDGTTRKLDGSMEWM